MWLQKKAPLSELFYLTLLLSALRPPDQLIFPRERLLWHSSSNTIGPLIAENIGHHFGNYFLSNDFYYSNYVNSKSPALLRETLDVLEDLNSLGRYSQPQHNYNLLAYPVSRGDSHVEPEEFPTSTSLDVSPSQSNLFDSILLDDLDTLPLDDLDINLLDDPLLDITNNSLFENLEDVGDIETEDLQTVNLDPETLLVDQSVMFPILDSDDGDVNDLFGELELLLSNETENYGQEWPSPPFYTPTAVSTDNGVEYALYDASHPVTTDSRNLYETVNSTSNLPSSSGSYANNFGAVLYSSLTTLSNGTDHVNAEQGSTNLVYSGNDAVGDPNYLSNVPSNVSSSDCFYSGYMEEFNMTDVAVTSSHPQQFGYSQAHQAQPAQPIASGFVANSTQPSISHFSGTSISNEDCFDKSSDSAVSSMSSDRVHSYSDNEWVETSSESSSYNGENNLTDYQHTDKSNTSAQKKYRLFGKSKQGEIKNATQSQNYYVDYSQMSTYIYPSSCPVNNSASSGEHYTALDYYQAGVLHNHTYAQPTELPSLSSISSTLSTSNEWSASENSDDKQSDTSRSFKTSSSKKLQEGSSQQKKDYHLNRDEKKARHLKIPISTHDIINLPIDEFNERLTKYELTDVQLSLIRDIRRRGKNKVAAQNCRKRKLDQIMGLQTEVDCMFSQKETLENQYNQLVMLREMARDKYTKLYQFVVEASSSRQPFFELTATPPDFPDKDSSREVHLTDSSGSSFLVSSNLSSLPITSYGVPNDFIKSED